VTGEAPDSSHESADGLNWLQRGLAGSVGAAAGVSGAIATFLDGTNVGGAPLLIAFGGVFAYLAISGDRLSGIGAGGSAQFLQARKRTTAMVEKATNDPDTPLELKNDLAQLVDEQRLPVSAPTRLALTTAAALYQEADRFETEAASLIQRLRPDLVVADLGGRHDRGYDFLVHDNRSRSLQVEVKYTTARTLTQGAVRRLVERLPVAPLLLIANRPPAPPAGEMLQTAGVTVVASDDPDGLASELARALQELLPPQAGSLTESAQP
jgi:hypothetical protein